jgi:FlgD Ig-like domain
MKPPNRTMNALPRRRCCLLLAAVAALLPPQTALGQWVTDGTPVFVGPGSQSVTDASFWGQTIIPDGAGGAIVAFKEAGGAVFGSSVQRIDVAGVVQWGTNGVLLTSVQTSAIAIVSDGAGGVITVWAQSGGGRDLYAQRVNSAGAVQWTPGGVAVCTAASWQDVPFIVSDGGGGAIVTWADNRNSVGDIYAQRLNAAGMSLWTIDGVLLCATNTANFRTVAAPDGFGGAVVAWEDDRSSPAPNDIYAQRVNDSGVPQWAANGVSVSDGNNTQQYLDIASTGDGGAVIMWEDQRTDPSGDIYAQRMDANGAKLWGPDDTAICTAANFQVSPHVIANGTYSAIVVWNDGRSGVGDIYGQVVDGGGAPLGIADGFAICDATGLQGTAVLTSDGSDGAIVSWTDVRSGGNDVYAQRINGVGAPQWIDDGIAVSAFSNTQFWPVITTDGAGGSIVAWTDGRQGTFDVYAQRVGSDGVAFSFTVTTAVMDDVTGSLWAAITQANATPGAQVIRFNLPGAGPDGIDASSEPVPAVTDQLTIDGFTQPGSSPNSNPIWSPSNAQLKVEISAINIGSPGFHFQAPGTLRGVVISGFGTPVRVQSPSVVIEGCYIGTDVSGNLSGIHTQNNGIEVLANNCRIGGSLPSSRVVIGNAYVAGIRVDGASNTQIYGCYIGGGANTTSYVGNWEAIHLLNGATGSWIGAGSLNEYPNPSFANHISQNYYGIIVEGSTSTGNYIAGNRMPYTSNIPIDLGFDGITNNDPLDADSGPNQLQNSPVLSSGVGHVISGTMNGTPLQSVYVHCYYSPTCCFTAADFIGGVFVSLDGAGTAPFALNFTKAIPPNSSINATATALNRNTSELSYSIVYQNTGSGSNVPVDLVAADGRILGSATYGSVSSVGNTFVTNPFTPPVPVSGSFSIGNPNDPQIYYDVTTDVSYSGGVDICLNYDENSIPGPEANLVLLHYEGSMWVNVTTSRDLVNNRICGHVTTLSPFVIGAVTTTGVGDTPAPASFALHPNVPNPFNPVTTIRYDIPAGGADVNIAIYDVAGRMVRELVNEHRGAGTWSVQWNGDDATGQRVASGVYFYRMRAGEFVETRKMVLLK